MAFFSYMSRVILLLLLLLILSPPFIQQAKNLAEADHKLIQALCHYSETPETCKRCVQSSHDAEKADSVGIAIIIVNCISDQAKTLASNMTKLASTTSDKELKTQCQRCANFYGYEIAKKELISAKQALQNNKYDIAESSVSKAQYDDIDCQKYLQLYKDQIPNEVLFGMNMYEELTEAACRIIEKLNV